MSRSRLSFRNRNYRVNCKSKCAYERKQMLVSSARKRNYRIGRRLI